VVVVATFDGTKECHSSEHNPRLNHTKINDEAEWS